MEDSGSNFTLPNLENVTDPNDLSNDPHYKAYLQAFRYGPPIIIGIGVIGNLFSLIVLRSTFFRKVPSSLGFTLLALVDLCILTVGLLPSWIGFVTDGKHDIRGLNNAGCKSHVFLTYMLAFLGPWTLVLITIERIISVMNPGLHPKLCSSVKIFIGWVAILLIMIGANLHFFWTFGLMRSSEEVTADILYDCKGLEKYDYFTNFIWPWVDFAVSFAAPFMIILISNITITIKLCAGRSNLKGRSEMDRVTSTTAMMITVSIVYLLTTSPIVIFNLILTYENLEMELGTIYLIYIIVNLIFYLNSAINSFLYFFSNAHFRKAAMMLICCRCYKSDLDLNLGETSMTDTRVSKGNL